MYHIIVQNQVNPTFPSLVLMPSSGQGRVFLPAAVSQSPALTTSWTRTGWAVSRKCQAKYLFIFKYHTISATDYSDESQLILPAYDGTQGDLTLTLPPGAKTKSVTVHILAAANYPSLLSGTSNGFVCGAENMLTTLEPLRLIKQFNSI